MPNGRRACGEKPVSGMALRLCAEPRDTVPYRNAALADNARKAMRPKENVRGLLLIGKAKKAIVNVNHSIKITKKEKEDDFSLAEMQLYNTSFADGHTQKDRFYI
jgi:hypothetical protein